LNRGKPSYASHFRLASLAKIFVKGNQRVFEGQLGGVGMGRILEVDEGEWEPTKWWRVLRGDDLWCETSIETEARKSMRPGDKLEHLWKLERYEWQQVPEEQA
jgi:hypothetical protein